MDLMLGSLDSDRCRGFVRSMERLTRAVPVRVSDARATGEAGGAAGAVGEAGEAAGEAAGGAGAAGASDGAGGDAGGGDASSGGVVYRQSTRFRQPPQLPAICGGDMPHPE